jgi:hypothetical protein
VKRAFTAGTILIALAIIVGAARAGEDSNPSRAPQRLSETGLYAELVSGRIAAGVLPFEPQYPLWTDGAAKSRWIGIPSGTAIDASDVNRWVFPVGTKLWKEFAFEGRKIETRLLWRASSEEWVFATYVWNDEQTDAFLAPAGGIRNHYRIGGSAPYSIPSEPDCRACHESGGTPVLGFNALQLSDDRDPLAPHAKPLDDSSMTLTRLDRLGLLAPRPPELIENAPRIYARSPRERAVLGYLSANCGSCHNEHGPLASLGLYLQHGATSLGWERAPAYSTSVDVAGHYVTPGVSPVSSRRVAPGSPEASAIIYRMSSRRPSSQMPPLGTAVVDEEALDLIRAWIAEDLGDGRGAVRVAAQGR